MSPESKTRGLVDVAFVASCRAPRASRLRTRRTNNDPARECRRPRPSRAHSSAVEAFGVASPNPSERLRLPLPRGSAASGPRPFRQSPSGPRIVLPRCRAMASSADPAQDEKARRVRSLLSSYYGSAPPSATNGAPPAPPIDTPDFDCDAYVERLVRETPLDALQTRCAEMAGEIRSWTATCRCSCTRTTASSSSPRTRSDA